MALQGTLKVRTEELTQQAGTVKTQIDRMESGFDALKRLVDGTTNFWIGEAGEHHRGLYQNKLGQIETILRRYREQVKDLEEMAGVYVSVEQLNEEISEVLPTSEL